MTIRLRLTLLYSGILAGTLLLFGVVLYLFLHFYIFNNFKSSLKAQTDMLQDKMQYEFGVNTNTKTWKLFIHLDDFNTVDSGMYLQIINLISNEKQKSSNLINLELPFSLETLKKNQAGYYVTSTLNNSPFLIYNSPLMLNGGLVGVLQSSYNIGVINMFFKILRLVLIFLSIIVICIASFMGWLFSKRALKPVYALISATDQIQKSEDFGIRIEHSGSQDEIGMLSKTINGMLERIQTIYIELDHLYVTQRRFVADASHELRTPLTTINGNAELLKKLWTAVANQAVRLPKDEEIVMTVEALNDITEEANRMGRLVNDLLALARADAGQHIKFEILELKPIVESVLRKAQVIPKNVELRIGSLDSMENIFIKGNKDYLQQLLFICIDNAFKFTSEGYVEFNTLRSADKIGVMIRDTGIGMDETDIPHIFERFYRADSSRGITPGTGLGLSIARWIMDEHEGTIDIESHKGEGTSFLIWLPISTAYQDQDLSLQN
jgi:two-component system OmpR family sensor kinase